MLGQPIGDYDWDSFMQPRRAWQWKSGHPHHLGGTYPDAWWWSFWITWAQIAGEYDREQKRIQQWLWFWQRLSDHFRSVVNAQKTMDALNAKGLHFVRHRNGWYGRVVGILEVLATVKKLGETSDSPMRVLMLRDRHYNYFQRERYVECSARDLTAIEPWPMDQLRPWEVFGIPQSIKFRWDAGREKRAERARKQVLRRQWRGLE